MEINIDTLDIIGIGARLYQLQNNPMPVDLSLYFTLSNIPEVCVAQVKTIERAVFHPRIRALKIQGRDTGEMLSVNYRGMARFIVNALERNTIIESLEVLNCHLDCDDAHLLAKWLVDNKTLTKLNISKNFIAEKGACAIANALLKNASLTHLDLSDKKSARKKFQYSIFGFRKLWIRSSKYFYFMLFLDEARKHPSNFKFKL
jgi:hypothetical protein